MKVWCSMNNPESPPPQTSDLYSVLTDLGIDFVEINHPPVFTSEEAAKHDLGQGSCRRSFREDGFGAGIRGHALGGPCEAAGARLSRSLSRFTKQNLEEARTMPARAARRSAHTIAQAILPENPTLAWPAVGPDCPGIIRSSFVIRLGRGAGLSRPLAG